MLQMAFHGNRKNLMVDGGLQTRPFCLKLIALGVVTIVRTLYNLAFPHPLTPSPKKGEGEPD